MLLARRSSAILNVPGKKTVEIIVSEMVLEHLAKVYNRDLGLNVNTLLVVIDFTIVLVAS